MLYRRKTITNNNIQIFATNFNILRIMSGMGSLSYSNQIRILIGILPGGPGAIGILISSAEDPLEFISETGDGND